MRIAGSFDLMLHVAKKLNFKMVQHSHICWAVEQSGILPSSEKDSIVCSAVFSHKEHLAGYSERNLSTYECTPKKLAVDQTLAEKKKCTPWY